MQIRHLWKTLFLAAKKWLWLGVFVMLCQTTTVYAQALPVAKPENVNRLLSGVLQQGMQKRGFAANDHRFGNTVARVSPVVSGFVGTGAAAAVTVGTITAPAWVTVALAAGIGAVVSYAVTLAFDGLVSWLFNEDSVDVSMAPINSEGSTISLGGAYWSAGSPRGTIYGGNGIAVARQSYTEWATQYEEIAVPICSSNASIAICTAAEPDAIGNYLTRQALYYSSGAPSSCVRGHFFLDGTGCIPYVADEGEYLEDVSPQRAIEAIPEEDLNKRVNPALLAALVNRAWQHGASQPDYDGLPYPQADPITQAEVSNWTQANPEFAPTVRDFVAPNPATNPNTNPWVLPSNPTAPNLSPAAPNTGTTNPAINQPLQNLGPDPGIGAPTLEAIPTAQQIAQPILDMLPNLSGYKPSSHIGECPRPTIELYGTHVLDAHCTLIDDNKAIIQAAMMLAWALIALIIVLSA